MNITTHLEIVSWSRPRWLKLGDLKAYVGLDESNTDHNTRLLLVLDAALREAEVYDVAAYAAATYRLRYNEDREYVVLPYSGDLNTTDTVVKSGATDVDYELVTGRLEFDGKTEITYADFAYEGDEEGDPVLKDRVYMRAADKFLYRDGS